MTGGFDLPAKYVIKAVGPVYENGDEYEVELLEGAYRSALELVAAKSLRSIFFPAISTGAFVFPMKQAAEIALEAIITFLKQEEHQSRARQDGALSPRKRTSAAHFCSGALADGG